MKFREHRASLVESLTTTVELDSLDALMTHLRKLAEPWPTFPPIDASTVTFELQGVDARLPDWRDTYMVRLKDYGVLGFIGDVLANVVIVTAPVTEVKGGIYRGDGK